MPLNLLGESDNIENNLVFIFFLLLLAKERSIEGSTLKQEWNIVIAKGVHSPVRVGELS